MRPWVALGIVGWIGCATGDANDPADSPPGAGDDASVPDPQGPGADASTPPADSGGGAAADARGKDAAPACAPGKTACGAACVDLSADTKNCGTCGHGCAGAEACTGGACVLTCNPGLTACGGACVDTTSDLANCGRCANACPGASAATCGTGTCRATLRVRAWVDGVSDLVFTGDTVHWHQIANAAPGVLGGMNEPTFLNAAPWTPTWPSAGENRDCNCDSQPSSTVPPLPARDQAVLFQKVTGRGSLNVTQQPSTANGYTFRVELSDPKAGADWYEFVLTYVTQ
jgi:hypothetical protein